MKKKSASKSAFFNPRVLISFAACATCVLLALLAFALYPGGNARAQGQDQSSMPEFVENINVAQGTVVRITATTLGDAFGLPALLGQALDSQALDWPAVVPVSPEEAATGKVSLDDPAQASPTPTPPGSLVLLDTFNTATFNVFTGSTPRTYMGDGFMNNTTYPGGSTYFVIRSYTFYMGSIAATAYTDIHARLALWNTYSASTTPVFANAAAFFDVDLGAFSTAANTFYSVDVTVLTPFPFFVGGPGTQWGYAQNFQSNTGGGLADDNNLTSLITTNHTGAVYPAGQITTGTSPIFGYYRNASAMTNFNFASTDSRSIAVPTPTPQPNTQGIGIIIRGDPANSPVPSPTTTPSPSGTPSPTPTATSTIPPTPSPTPTPQQSPTPQPTPCTIIYDQTDAASTNATNSQHFGAADVTFDNQAADDFIVPVGQTWNIQQVVASGAYFNGAGPAPSFSVYFYNDAGGLPGAQIGSTQTNLPYTQVGSLFTIFLGSNVVLTSSPGHYWVSVQANMDFNAGGQWGWTDRTVTTNNPAAWQNPGGGFATACNSWGARGATCAIDAAAPDQAFKLVGCISGISPTPTPATPTPTPSPTPTATATACGSSGNMILDGGFELNTDTGTNPDWTSTSTAFGSSLCTVTFCGTGGGSAAPRTGNGWVWFDGTGDGTTAEDGTAAQTVTLPTGSTITLTYYLEVGAVTAPSSSVLTVKVDGNVAETVTEPAVADTTYNLHTVDLSSFGNGAARSITFSYSRPAGTTGSDNFTVDDVALVFSTACPSPTPTVVSISGKVTYCSDPTLPPVPGVTMTLTGSSSGSTTTDALGNYTFAGLASGGSYTVTPTKPSLVPGSSGINTSDAIAIQRHFLNLGTPLSGCRLTAADVNIPPNGVTTSDAIAVQRFFLSLVGGLAQTGTYRFNPVTRSYSPLLINQTGQNFDAVILGDVGPGFVFRPEGGQSQDAATSVASTVAAVALPDVAIDQSKSNFVAAVRTSAIDAKENLVGFQGDFTFDERAVTFQSQPVQPAGLTARNWSVSGNVLPGAGPIRTLRVSAFSLDFAPLSGSGPLFELKMTKASQTAQGTPLIWAPSPEQQFIFIDADLKTQKPGNTSPGSVTTSAKRK